MQFMPAIFAMEHFLKPNLIIIGFRLKKIKTIQEEVLKKPREQTILIKNRGLTECKRKLCDQLRNSPLLGYTY